MANNVIKRVWNQNRMVSIEDLKGMTFQAESGGHTFQISGVDDSGNTVALTGSVAGVFLRPDNTDVAISGSASGGVASVTLSAECYDVPGRFGLTVFVTANGQKTAVYAAVGTVSRTSSGTVSPGTTSDVVDLINRINAAVATIPASWTGLMADIAPTYSDAAVYPVGAYVYYNGDLYRCTTAITTAESWTAGHWTQAVLGNDVSNLKSAVSEIRQHTKNLADYSLYVGAGITLNDTVLSGTGGSFNGAEFAFDGGANKQYRVSFDAKTDGNSTTSGGGLRFRLHYTDDTASSWGTFANSDLSYTHYSLFSAEGKTVDKLQWSLSSGVSNTWYVKNLQIEEGTTETAYESPFTAYDKKAETKNGEQDARLNTLENSVFNDHFILDLIKEKTINLADYASMIESGLAYEDGIFSASASVFNGLQVGLAGKENTRYRIAFEAYTNGVTSSGTGLRYRFHYSDDTYSAWVSFANNTNAWASTSMTSTPNMTIVGYEFSISSGLNNTWYVRNFIITEGSDVNEYVPPYIPKIDNELVTDYEKLPTEFYPGFYMDTGVIGNPGSNKDTYSPKYVAHTGDRFRFTIRYGQAYTSFFAYVVYDTNGTFIARVTPLGITANVETYSAEFRITHANVGYIAFTYYSQNDSEIIIERKRSVFNWFDDTKENESNIDYLKYCLNDNIKSVNHRGYNSVAPENTLPAFQLTKMHGFKYVETDVQFTSDGVPVLLHDETINRTARNADGTELGQTVYIRDITYAQALEYDFGLWKSTKYAGTKIMRFDDFLLFCKRTGLHPYIETKAGTQAQVESLVDMVRAYGMKGHVTWDAFHENISKLEWIKEVDPSARIGMAVDFISDGLIELAQTLKTTTNEVFLMCYVDGLEDIQKCIDANMPVEVWTTNIVEQILGLNPFISGVLSDRVNAGDVIARIALGLTPHF